jgi:hypothetical protein
MSLSRPTKQEKKRLTQLYHLSPRLRRVTPEFILADDEYFLFDALF